MKVGKHKNTEDSCGVNLIELCDLFKTKSERNHNTSYIPHYRGDVIKSRAVLP